MGFYLHLLSEDDFAKLRDVLRALRSKRKEVLDAWHVRYDLHFGSDRSLARPEFLAIFGADLDALLDALEAGDLEALERGERALGSRLLARGVPFEEIIASLHLFEESAIPYLRRRPSVLVHGPEIFLTFDKLSHVRMMLLAQSYFRAHEAEHSTQRSALERDAAQLDPQAAHRETFHGMVGGTPVMRALYQRIQVAARSRAPVFVAGESGTGKELVARAVHACGSPVTAPFIAVNCAALPADLVESELFGHQRGAFSGALTDHAGLVAAAAGGTLFLDEITEMSAGVQAKLLRTLQEGSVRPVGSTHEKPVDVRFIASTNRDLKEALAQGRLRSDLYYRLQVHQLDVPPLRERSADIPLLAAHALSRLALRDERTVARLDDTALRALTAYQWPGNVRELLNALEVAVAYGSGESIQVADLPPEITGVQTGAATTSVASPPAAAQRVTTFAESERALILRALDLTAGNKVQAARLLAISRKQLYAKIRKYAIDSAD